MKQYMPHMGILLASLTFIGIGSSKVCFSGNINIWQLAKSISNTADSIEAVVQNGLPASNKVITYIYQTDIPYTISQPGLYYLAENIVFTSTATAGAITLATRDAILDLRGHTADGGSPANGSSAIVFLNGTDFTNSTFMNGRINNFSRGIYVDSVLSSSSTSQYIEVDSIMFRDTSAAVGIDSSNVGVAKVKNCSFTNCEVCVAEVCGVNCAEKHLIVQDCFFSRGLGGGASGGITMITVNMGKVLVERCMATESAGSRSFLFIGNQFTTMKDSFFSGNSSSLGDITALGVTSEALIQRVIGVNSSYDGTFGDLFNGITIENSTLVSCGGNTQRSIFLNENNNSAHRNVVAHSLATGFESGGSGNFFSTNVAYQNATNYVGVTDPIVALPNATTKYWTNVSN